MAKYINTAMAIEALEKGLNVWVWAPSDKRWDISGLSSLTQKDCGHRHFAIGEKPTSPPRKMIAIDGVMMPAPILDIEDVPEAFWVLSGHGTAIDTSDKSYWSGAIRSGNVYATEADAIAARDGWLKVKKQAMERAK